MLVMADWQTDRQPGTGKWTERATPHSPHLNASKVSGLMEMDRIDRLISPSQQDAAFLIQET
jgi:hypothetical protein